VPGFIVDMHVHTVKGASDSSLTPQQLVEEARRIGLNGVAISEHDRLWDAREMERFRQESGLFAGRAMEVSTELGHIIVLGLERYTPGIHKTADLRRAVTKAGGFMWLAHPFRHFFDPVHFLRDGRPQPNLTTDEAARLPIFALVDDLEVANGGCTAQENAFALAVARILGKRGIGASDAHSTHGLGCFTTVFRQPLADERELIAELHSGCYHPAEGLLSGALVAFGESASDINASSSPHGGT
jgi:predicted metal-dependent phosphoesterase TrpH